MSSNGDYKTKVWIVSTTENKLAQPAELRIAGGTLTITQGQTEVFRSALATTKVAYSGQAALAFVAMHTVLQNAEGKTVNIYFSSNRLRFPVAAVLLLALAAAVMSNSIQIIGIAGVVMLVIMYGLYAYSKKNKGLSIVRTAVTQAGGTVGGTVVDSGTEQSMHKGMRLASQITTPVVALMVGAMLYLILFAGLSLLGVQASGDRLWLQLALYVLLVVLVYLPIYRAMIAFGNYVIKIYKGK